MIILERNIPDYLTDKRNIVSFILFTAVFALVFIHIYSPFGVDAWLNVTEVELFVYSSIVILIGMLVIVISRLFMHLRTRKHHLSYGQYALWIIGEISSLALVYALIQWFFLHVGDNFLAVLRNTIRTTAWIILIPYVIFWLYAALRDKYAALEKIENNLSTQDLPDLTDRRSAPGLSMVPFRDEKGVLKFSIKKEDLLYIESADNYIMIYYLDGEKPAKYIVRNTLKRIEQELPNAGLVRSHRSYMVNIDRVKVIRKEKEGLVIGFESPAHITVPISKTYLDVFIRKLSD
ncbi:MAG: LytTR family transcriptional regulator [Bacteroidales bacterium]|nr:LytTR family transcriptional regulator [Bacteroidales bacterium]